MNDIKIGVLGLGYVGLPIFLSLRNKFNTIGFDIDHERILDLKRDMIKTLNFQKTSLILIKIHPLQIIFMI